VHAYPFRNFFYIANRQKIVRLANRPVTVRKSLANRLIANRSYKGWRD
jgi:hypothetical protein